jgi:excisionase family DNA binding protein
MISDTRPTPFDTDHEVPLNNSRNPPLASPGGFRLGGRNYRTSAPDSGLPASGTPTGGRTTVRTRGRNDSSSGSTSSHMPALLTVAEVAALLRTTKKAIYAMCERCQFPGVHRIGRRVLVRQDVLLEWLRQRSTPSPEG